jgi:hypothetical protein
VRLDGGGRYRATTGFTDRIDPGVPLTGGLFAEGTISFSVRVLAGGLARGTVRVLTDYSETEGGPAVSRCDTGSIPWSARRPSAGAGLTVSVDCPSAIGLPLDVVAKRMRVRRGRFGAAGHFEREYTDPDGSRVVERHRWKLHARFGRRGARGTFELTGVVRRRSDGRQVGSCATGKVAWRAVR